MLLMYNCTKVNLPCENVGSFLKNIPKEIYFLIIIDYLSKLHLSIRKKKHDYFLTNILFIKKFYLTIVFCKTLLYIFFY